MDNILFVVLIVTIILVLVFTYSWCKIGGEQSRLEEQQEIDETFDGYKYCDDDCYMCNAQRKCQRSMIKENKCKN